MKSGGTYRFSLSWPMDTQERILAGEFLNKLGNKKSRFLVQLVCEYLNANPRVMDSKESIKLIVESTPVGDALVDMIRNIVQSEMANKTLITDGQQLTTSNSDHPLAEDDTDIENMLDNLDFFN